MRYKKGSTQSMEQRSPQNIFLWLEPRVGQNGIVLCREFTCLQSLEVQGCNLSSNHMAQEDASRPSAQTNGD